MVDKQMPKISVGIISITTILCVLCFTVLSVLSLSTAISERRFSEKRAVAVQNYYSAETKAAEICNTLRLKIHNNEDLQFFMDEKNITEIEEEYRFQVPIDEAQVLSVAVEHNNECKILCWQAETISDWTPDISLPVWNGEELYEE